MTVVLTETIDKWTGVSGDTKPASPAYIGSEFYETDTGATYIWNGTAWVLKATEHQLRVQDYEQRLVVDQNLTADGVQWSTEVTTSDGTYTEVLAVSIDPGVDGAVLWIEFGITWAMKSSGAAKFVKGKLQGRNASGTWTDMHTEITYAADASAYAEYTRQGYFQHANMNEVPCEVRLVIQREDAGENGTAKVKSSSYVRAVYQSP